MEQKKFILINLSIILVLSIIAGILLYRLNQKEAENVQEIADEKIVANISFVRSLLSFCKNCFIFPVILLDICTPS